jgi:hypothetical protein
VMTFLWYNEKNVRVQYYRTELQSIDNISMSYCIDYVIMAYYQRYQVSKESNLTDKTTTDSILSLLGRHDIIIESHKKDCVKLLLNNVILYICQDESTTVHVL